MEYSDYLKEPYEILSSATETAYKHVIEQLDSEDGNKGYRDKKGKPGARSNKEIASEIYSYFTTHYFKAIDVFIRNRYKIIDDFINETINIIDIGANIGTVTFAYIDILKLCSIAENVNINIIFIEPGEYRTYLLNKSINKYIEVSKLNITYNIVDKTYEESISEIKRYISNSNTIILISNILNWIEDRNWEDFKKSIIQNLNIIDDTYGCKLINIEATSENGSQHKIKKLYEELPNNYEKFNSKTSMPEFNNIPESYFYKQNKIYKNKSREYYYGYLMKYRKFEDKIDIGYLDSAMNKALYSCKNNVIYDYLEMKYVNLNFNKLKEYIFDLIISGRRAESHNYQYRIKKNSEKTRPLLIDDFINEIISTTLIISEGLIADINQDNNISYGNRINEDINSPFVYIPYYIKYFDDLKEKEREYSKEYKYYYKIDLKQYYSNINHKILKDIVKEYPSLQKSWSSKQIDMHINRNLYDCKEGCGLAQGPDLSHLLANIYLNKFDTWFKMNFHNMRLIRYVDDMEIIGDSLESCKNAFDLCKEYLENELQLEINENKTENGNIRGLIESSDEDYFELISSLCNYILKSLYKLDKKNYNNYLNNKIEFLKVYKKCLEKLGIYISIDWLNIKIQAEVDYLGRMKKKFNEKEKKLLNWFKKKNIYDINLRLGRIPKSESKYLIDEWYKEFKENNKEFIIYIDTLKLKLEEKFNSILIEVNSDKNKANHYKSNFKFIMNKFKIFKSSLIPDNIEWILDNFPYCNRKIFSTYNELYSYIKMEVSSEIGKVDNNYDSYESIINIWLLGEYRNEDALSILEELYLKSVEKENSFLNTIVTEAVLKIGKVRHEFINQVRKVLSTSNNYYYIRNALFIYNLTGKINEIELIDNPYFNDARVAIFIKWISNNNFNIIDELEDIPDKYKDKYPNYPINDMYLSF